VGTLENLAVLVGFETVSRSSNLAMIDWCSDQAQRHGGDAAVLPGADGRANLLLTFGPSQAAGGVLLAAHSDVVPPGGGWSTDPFRLARRGDALVGRGSADMKGFLASALAAAGAVDATRLRAPLRIAISYDEEIGCQGVHGLLEHLRCAQADPALVIVGEPTSMRVCTAHSGKIAYDVDIASAACHSSRSPTHPSALVAAAELAVAVDRVQRTRPNPGDGSVATNVGRIAGGAGLNVIAPRAELAFEVRHQAELDIDELLTPVWDSVDEIRRRLATVGGSVAVTETIRYPGLAHRAPDEPVRQLAAACGEPELSAIDFGCEAGLYATALAAPIVICGPGDIRDAHRPDEFVTVEQLQRCDASLARIVAELCS
jgi:acetylornithine deacetylase